MSDPKKPIAPSDVHVLPPGTKVQWSKAFLAKVALLAKVRSFETDEPLDGSASPELVAATGGGDAAAAYRDDAGVWQLVKPEDQRRMLEEGHDVVPVVVMVPS